MALMSWLCRWKIKETLSRMRILDRTEVKIDDSQFEAALPVTHWANMEIQVVKHPGLSSVLTERFQKLPRRRLTMGEVKRAVRGPVARAREMIKGGSYMAHVWKKSHFGGIE
jgi:hypothetical protein